MITRRNKPRISVNALTEYLSTNAARRRRIVEGQKYPPDFQRIYYQPASEAVMRFLCANCEDEEILVSEVDRLYAEPVKNEYEEHRWPSNAEALQSFLDFYDVLDLGDLAVTRTATKLPKLSFAGTEVSVYPELTLTGALPRHGEVIGGINFYFSKNVKLHLRDDTGAYPSALVYELMSRNSGGRKPLPRICLTVDIFGQSVYAAPRAYKRILREVEVACEEIAMWWGQL